MSQTFTAANILVSYLSLGFTAAKILVTYLNMIFNKSMSSHVKIMKENSMNLTKN